MRRGLRKLKLYGFVLALLSSRNFAVLVGHFVILLLKNLRFCHVLNFRGLEHRQRNARRRPSQSKEDWVEGFVLGGKKES